jgi:hypothetical protein
MFAPKGPKDVLKSSKQNVKESIRELDRELMVRRKECPFISNPHNETKHPYGTCVIAGNEKRGRKTNRRD